MDTPQGVYKIKGAFADVHKTNFFEGDCPIEEANTSKPKTTMKLKDWMYIVDTGGDGRRFSYLTGETASGKQEHYMENSNSERYRQFHEAKVYIQGLSIFFFVKVGGRFSFGVVLGTIMRGVGLLFLGGTGRPYQINAR